MFNQKPSARLPGDTHGFGCEDAEVYTGHVMSLRDHYPLTDQNGEVLSQKHLNKLISVQVIVDLFDGDGTKQKLVYFLEDGKVFKVSETNVLLKTWKELQYVLYLLTVKNETTRKWSRYIKKTISDKKKGTKAKSDGAYIPKYVLDDDTEIEMILHSAYFETTFTVRHLSFNKNGKRLRCIYFDESMGKNSIYNLKAAINQTKGCYSRACSIEEGNNPDFRCC